MIGHYQFRQRGGGFFQITEPMGHGCFHKHHSSLIQRHKIGLHEPRIESIDIQRFAAVLKTARQFIGKIQIAQFGIGVADSFLCKLRIWMCQCPERARWALSAQLADRSLSRTYEAVVWGRVREDSGVIDAPIGRHPTDRKRMAVAPKGSHPTDRKRMAVAPIGRHPTDRKRMAVTEKSSRNAVTRFEVIARYNGYTHVRCKLETGRTHQIRVHMAHIGHPLLGDEVYCKRSSPKGLEGQCLHARELKFIHPETGERVELQSELPEYFVNVLSRLGAVE